MGSEMNDQGGGGKNLRLPDGLPLGAGREQTQAVTKTWNTVDIVLEEMELRGLGQKDQPVFQCPELDVEVLTTNDSRHYSQTYAELLAWFGYVSTIHAEIKARVLQYKNMQRVLAAQSKKTQRDVKTGVKKPTKDELEEALLLNPEYQQVTLELQRHEQANFLYDAKVDNIERSLRLISRQIEVRRLDIEQTRTQDGMTNRGPMGYSRLGRPQ